MPIFENFKSLGQCDLFISITDYRNSLNLKPFRFVEPYINYFMKKLFLLFSFIYIFQSCSSDDSSENGNNTNSNLHPPTWIQATWKDDLKVTGYSFTNNDIITLQVGIETGLKSQTEVIEKAKGTAVVEETITDSSYKVKITFNGSSTIYYEFVKMGTNKIIWKTDAVDSKLIKQ